MAAAMSRPIQAAQAMAAMAAMATRSPTSPTSPMVQALVGWPWVWVVACWLACSSVTCWTEHMYVMCSLPDERARQQEVWAVC